MLEAIKISKSFPGVQALHEVNISLYPSKVNAILGENGAGKSTLLKIFTGVYTDYEGELKLNNQVVKFKNIKDAQQAGIAIIHQELNLIPTLSIRENLFLGQEFLTSWGTLDTNKMNHLALHLMSKLQLSYSPDTLVQNLKTGEQQLVEIAKALLSDAQIILMDEPTSALSTKEIENLHRIILELKSTGKTIAYISHKMDELFRLADTYTVLRDGKTVDAGEMHQTTEKDLIRKLVGREIISSKKSKQLSDQDNILEIDNISLQHPAISSKKILANISFTLQRGEILGIFGLMGAGRTELLETIFGLYSPLLTGSILIENKQTRINHPADAIKHGIAFATEDRKSEGLVLGMSLRSNISLTSIQDDILIHEQKEKSLAEQYINQLGIKTPSDNQLCMNLSGGNQQKIVLAKWLATNPKIFLLDEPTRGIDIKAKNEIYQIIHRLTEENKSIIIVSSEIPEILTLSDRIIVMAGGKVSAVFSAMEATEEKLLKAAI